MTSLARRNRIKELWLGIPETWRTELMSAFHTFVPAFIGTLAVSISLMEGLSWTRDTLIAAVGAALLAALRAGFKAVSMWVLTRVLPDPKNTK